MMIGKNLREVAHLDDQGGHPEREPDGEEHLDHDQQRHPHGLDVRDKAIEDEEQHERDPRQDGVHRGHQDGLERKALPRELRLAHQVVVGQQRGAPGAQRLGEEGPGQDPDEGEDRVRDPGGMPNALVREKMMVKMPSMAIGAISAQSTPRVACLYWARMSRSARV